MEYLMLRKAGERDSEFVYLVRKRAFRAYVDAVGRWDEEEQRQLHRKRFASQDFWIVQIAGDDVGVISLGREPDRLHLHQLFLLPEHQGKGIGRVCVEWALAEGRKANLPVYLRVLKVNPRARAFYERLGFEKVGETVSHDLLRVTSVGQSSTYGHQAV